MQNTYLAKRARLENYFNEVSSDAWDKLTSNEPVSFVRQLVREGREKMQIAIMEKLPHDLKGMRILDAGCGTGVLSRMLDERGAEVVGVDISDKLIDVAKNRSAANKNIEYLSNTGITFKICESWFLNKNEEEQRSIVKGICKTLSEENVAHDINGYAKAPPSFRVWAGGTVEPDNIEKLLPWLEWAYMRAKEDNA